MMNKLEVLAAVMQQHEAHLRQRKNEFENNNVCNENENREKFDDTARHHGQIFDSEKGNCFQINANESEDSEYSSLLGKEDADPCGEGNDLSILNFSWNETQGQESIKVNKQIDPDHEHTCLDVEESINSQIENDVRTTEYFRKLRPRSKKVTKLLDEGNIVEEDSMKNINVEKHDRKGTDPLLQENIDIAEPSREMVSSISESNLENDENISERYCKYYKGNILARISPLLEQDKTEAKADITTYAEADIETSAKTDNRIQGKTHIVTCMRPDDAKLDARHDTRPDAKLELRKDTKPNAKPEVRSDMKPEPSIEEISKSKDWEIAETRHGKYFLDFKSPYFTMNERIRILEAALEDIRERYIEVKDEYQRFNRKCTRWRRKRRTNGSI